jgi:hypothetical protein
LTPDLQYGESSCNRRGRLHWIASGQLADGPEGVALVDLSGGYADIVTRGTPYELQIHLNRPAVDVTGVTYYYTTDRANPTQSGAQRYTTRSVSGPFHIHLPSIVAVGGAAATGDTFPSADLKFMWDTAPVAPNTYYLCTVVSVSPNTATYCSDTPIQVHLWLSGPPRARAGRRTRR